MRKSKVLRKIREGKTAFCLKINVTTPRMAEIAAMSGIDCIWVDMEHTPSNVTDVEDIVRAAKVYDCDVLTRVSKGSYSDFIRPYEADSTGIMVPHLMSLEEAKRVVYFTKFHPIGRRPIDGGNADGKFCMVSVADYVKEANEERFNVVQIEDPEAMEHLEEICSLPGIDMIFFGPADFSHGLGMPADVGNEQTLQARRLVAQTARKHGKMAGTVGSVENYRALEAEGFNFINVGGDVVLLAEHFARIARTVTED